MLDIERSISKILQSKTLVLLKSQTLYGYYYEKHWTDDIILNNFTYIMFSPEQMNLLNKFDIEDVYRKRYTDKHEENIAYSVIVEYYGMFDNPKKALEFKLRWF